MTIFKVSKSNSEKKEKEKECSEYKKSRAKK